MHDPTLEEDSSWIPPEVQKLLDNRVPFHLWEKGVFLRYLEILPDDEWTGPVLDRATPGARNLELTEWQAKAVANERPVLLRVPEARSTAEHRRLQLLRHVRNNPQVQSALTVLRSFVNQLESWDPEPILFAEAYRVARDIRVPGMDRLEVAYFLTDSTLFPREVLELLVDHFDDTTNENAAERLNHLDSQRIPGGPPRAWANLNRTPVQLTLRPGAIVVDVTGHSDEDLDSVFWKIVDEANRALGHPKPTGGNRANDELNEFIVELWNYRTPKGKKLTLQEKTKRVNKRFDRDLSEDAVQNRYLSYMKRITR